jgi:outer membrane receptor protein involved in Fe transport
MLVCIEAVLQGNLGYGTTVYTGADRYSIKNFQIGQYKIELKGDNFFIRGYTTQERSGDSYANGTLGQLMNEGWGGGSGTWFPTYVGAFVQGRSGGLADAAAHIAARAFADKNRPAPGSTEFNAIKDKSTAVAIPNGAKFTDKTNLYQVEGMYNFKNQIKFAEFMVGGHFRRYQLNSDGTIFADKDGRKINIDEWGTYAQASKQFGEVFKLTTSLRYDKNPNFDGQWTPRVSGVFTIAKDHNFRVSYQTAFRIPTTQDQYIDLKVPQARLVGGLPEFANTYNFTGNPIYTIANLTAYGAEVQRVAGLAATQTTAVGLITSYVRTQVTPAVTAGVNANVTTLVTNQVTALVTAQVTAGVNVAVAAGQVANTPTAIAAAIAAGLAAQAATTKATIDATIPIEVAKALPGEIQKAVDANAPAAIAANASNVVTALAIDAANKANILKPYAPRKWNPEKVKSFEIGYKAMINKKLFVDAYWYYNEYSNFSAGATVAQVNETAKATLNAQAAQLAALAGPAYASLNMIPAGLLSSQTRQIYQFPGSSDGKTVSQGWALGLDYSLSKGYNISGNVSYNNLKSFDPIILAEGGRSSFNTPNYRYNLGFSKRATTTGLGFNVTWRMQDAFVWQTSFVNTPDINAAVVPSFTTVDAQISKKIKSLKTLLKIGGSNIFNQYYITSYGNPSIGGIYYVSLSFDQLFN